ncbi:RBP11-like subunits of RNA polymerase [Fimicolochytrium jonesii]|uniref:RBP11-like subunits of RNA polymerase n=1 Tax=Fimicolochytrium jonesii TaxID=1396493 RepID=UPI0022FE757D|nr:RBP11-like subunits of RNA polymerase [Fimicolochytrium jonesii]KAI8826677.1 RBP11-like subunits of RNA polymerase [Fimicolochytrium jonesii]
MSNAPAPQELYLMPEGVPKAIEIKDTKIPNAATFHIEKEDHTLGNLLRMELLNNRKVLFAGYRMPHPLDHSIDLKVQTTPETSPLQVMQEDINGVIKQISQIKRKFESEVESYTQSKAGSTNGAFRVDRAYL